MRDLIDLLETSHEIRLPLPGEKPFWVDALAPLTKKLMSENDYCDWTWTTGGCFAFAEALARATKGERWGVCEEEPDQPGAAFPTNHAVVRVAGVFYDFDGVFNAEAYMAKLERERGKKQYLKPKGAGNPRFAEWFRDEFLDDDDLKFLRKALSPLRKKTEGSQISGEQLVENDLKKFLIAAGAAGLIAGGHVATQKFKNPEGTTWTQDGDPQRWGGGDWFGGDDSEARTMASPRAFTNAREIAYLAATIWGEARNQGVDGMKAVGHVIVNRALDDRWGSSIQEVVSRPKQFSCWNSGDPNREKIRRMNEIDRYIREKPEGFEQWYERFQRSSEYGEYTKWVEAKRIARGIVTGRDRDPTGGALFYHTTAIEPYWAKGMSPTTRLGDHIFYRDLTDQ